LKYYSQAANETGLTMIVWNSKAKADWFAWPRDKPRYYANDSHPIRVGVIHNAASLLRDLETSISVLISVSD